MVQKQFHDVVVSTYGAASTCSTTSRPLEQGTPATTDAAVHLFAPRPAYRWTQRGRALINYSLKAVPKGAVQLQVLDGQGKVVRDLRTTPREGLNRVSWDLRYEPPTLIAMRTTPVENPHIWEDRASVDRTRGRSRTGTRAGAGRTDRRAGPVHGETDGRRSVVHPAD